MKKAWPDFKKNMRAFRMCAFPALVVLLMGNALSAVGAPVLQVKVLDAKTVVVRGKGFPDEKLLVSADTDMPHASVACYTDLTRVALVKGDEFEVAINPRECDFRCSRDHSGYVVSMGTLNGTALAEAKFECVPPGAGSAK